MFGQMLFEWYYSNHFDVIKIVTKIRLEQNLHNQKSYKILLYEDFTKKTELFKGWSSFEWDHLGQTPGKNCQEHYKKKENTKIILHIAQHLRLRFPTTSTGALTCAE